MENLNKNDIRYIEAAKRVKRIKGFYIHAIVYFLVNLFIIAQSVQAGESLSNLNIYWTAILWGVALTGHGLSVFLPNFILGKNWEEEKIRDLMNKNK
ncbi:2TM domain-containing protein [Chryseobacterium sp. SNU WT5]|uniref:2TM domain-containing protein n=1 Tax=Chryseobacterium sp. SNU WT5 TaxID=2594269 RepID=UPI00117EB2BC|nr:2TM domain-containing protein [Chryseobacterium sp. SNU WT5]QDP85330.1 2TM domain-containing protein [Chryseobacterium sp. SNU WT5]